MAKIALNLTKTSRSAKVSLVNTVEAKTPDVSGFPSPNPKLVELLAARQNVIAREMARSTIEAQLRSANADLQTADERLDAAIVAHARQTEEVTGGDEAKITLLGYSVASAPQAVGPMAQPENLTATVGDSDEAIDGAWNRVFGAKSYEAQTSADPITDGSWVHALTTTKSSVTITGLPSGKKRWLRVRAIGALGAGPWSDPACCMVP